MEVLEVLGCVATCIGIISYGLYFALSIVEKVYKAVTKNISK